MYDPLKEIEALLFEYDRSIALILADWVEETCLMKELADQLRVDPNRDIDDNGKVIHAPGKKHCHFAYYRDVLEPIYCLFKNRKTLPKMSTW